MGKRKEHHFIPQFYLRNFSVGQNRVVICIYNIETDFYFDRAAISDQAKMKYLYGQDDRIESMLGDIERKAALVIKKIINTDSLPGIKSEIQDLFRFILYQHTRTVKREEVIKENLNALNKDIKRVTGHSFNISIQEMVDMVERTLPFLSHIKMALIVNDTSIPFITSDHPVVLYNQLMEIKGHSCRAAWANKGLQVFFPISPDHLIYIYDCYSYTVGKNKNKGEVLSIMENDVKQLNLLQYLNCGTLLFFDEHLSKDALVNMVHPHYSFRKQLFIPKTFRFGSYRWVEMPEPRINLSLTFSKLSLHGKRWRPTNYMVYLRHSDFAALRNSLDKEVVQ